MDSTRTWALPVNRIEQAEGPPHAIGWFESPAVDAGVLRHVVHYAGHFKVEKRELCYQSLLSTHEKVEEKGDVVILLGPLRQIRRIGREGGVTQLGRLRTLDDGCRCEPMHMLHGVGQT